MALPLRWIFASLMLLSYLPSSHAQVINFQSTVNFSSSSSSTPATAAASSSSVNFSLMNWRSASLSPYSQPAITSSTTTNTTTAPSVIPSTTNPYVGATLSSQGSLTGNTSTASTTTSAAVTSPSAPRSSGSYSSRFVSYTTTPIENATTTVIGSTIGSNSNSFVTPISLPTELSNSSIVSVPEPGTVALCLGLAAMMGLGYSRRQWKNEKALPADVTCVDAAASVDETISA